MSQSGEAGATLLRSSMLQAESASGPEALNFPSAEHMKPLRRIRTHPRRRSFFVNCLLALLVLALGTMALRALVRLVAHDRREQDAWGNVGLDQKPTAAQLAALRADPSVVPQAETTNVLKRAGAGPEHVDAAGEAAAKPTTTQAPSSRPGSQPGAQRGGGRTADQTAQYAQQMPVYTVSAAAKDAASSAPAQELIERREWIQLQLYMMQRLQPELTRSDVRDAVIGAMASHEAALDANITCTGGYTGYERELTSSQDVCAMSNLLIYEGIAFACSSDESKHGIALALPDMAFVRPPEERSTIRDYKFLKAWRSRAAPVRWPRGQGTAVIERVVMLTREQLNSLYLTWTSDTANAFSMLCERFGMCSGVASDVPGSLLQPPGKDRAAHDSLVGDAGNAVGGGEHSSSAGAASRAYRRMLEEQAKATDLTQSGTPPAPTSGAEDGKQGPQWLYKSAIVFADGSGDGAAVTPYPELWACLSDFPTIVTGPKDEQSRTDVLLMLNTTMGLGDHCRGDFWCSKGRGDYIAQLNPISSHKGTLKWVPDRNPLPAATMAQWHAAMRSCLAGTGSGLHSHDYIVVVTEQAGCESWGTQIETVANVDAIGEALTAALPGWALYTATVTNDKVDRKVAALVSGARAVVLVAHPELACNTGLAYTTLLPANASIAAVQSPIFWDVYYPYAPGTFEQGLLQDLQEAVGIRWSWIPSDTSLSNATHVHIDSAELMQFLTSSDSTL